MRDIKTRKTVKDIKVLDKSGNLSARMKNAYQRTEQLADETQTPHDVTPAEYATENIRNKTRDLTNETVRRFKNPYQQARQNIQNAKGYFQEVKRQLSSVKSTVKGFKDTSKNTIKTAGNTVKTAHRTAKTAQKTAKAAGKSARAAKQAARTAAKTTKSAIKAVIKMTKAIIASVKGTVALIAAGGWIAVLIILIICMVAILLSSVFGIFFSGETSSGPDMTLKSVITEINEEYTNTINGIIDDNPHDILDIADIQPEWEQVLAVYTVKMATDPNNPMEVSTMNDEKAAILREVFWDMNVITYTLDTTEVTKNVIGNDGLPTGEAISSDKIILSITIIHKIPEEMATEYEFTDEQRQLMTELFKPKYDDLWRNLVSDIALSNDVSLALQRTLKFTIP